MGPQAHYAVRINIAYFIGGIRGATYPIHYISLFFLHSFFSFALVRKEEHDGSSWEKWEDSCYIGFILIFAHDCATCVWYASIGTRWRIGECLFFSICFESMNISDCSVWTFERNIGVTNRLLLVFFIEKNCSSKELMYLIRHSSVILSG